MGGTRRSPKQPPRRSTTHADWVPPDLDKQRFEFRVADSVLQEFVLGHEPSDVLRELVQNEYDAGGTRLTLTFGASVLRITGNGKPVDRAGWRRLSVMLGTGHVSGEHEGIEAKTNGLGSKNFGLRSLFLYGDQIFIRSGGQQTVLDVRAGAFPAPIPDPSSRHLPGIHLEVPYRHAPTDRLEAFSAAKEELTLASYQEHIASTVIKLAQPGTRKNLQELVVTSERCQRKLAWKQQVNVLPCRQRGVRLLHRIIRSQDTKVFDDRPRFRQAMEELEFQTILSSPKGFESQRVPGYFKIPGGRIRLGLSLRIQRDKIQLGEQGRFYYPLAASRGFTGTAVSISAPFQMDADRSQIVSSTNSAWNAWLLEEACQLTLRLLASDWVSRFGSAAFLCLDEEPFGGSTDYSRRVTEHLRNDKVWPTRTLKENKPAIPTLTHVGYLVIPEDPSLDKFVGEDRYLDDRLGRDPDLNSFARRLGAKTFTVNSLIRLRCAGKDRRGLSTQLSDNEADFSWSDFPKPLESLDYQVRIAAALNALHRKLSARNREDLSRAKSTLTAAETLEAPNAPLWIVEHGMADVCPVPVNERLHPQLAFCKPLVNLCRKYDASDWLCETAENVNQGRASNAQRQALYRYILSRSGQVGRRALPLIRRAKVLLDHRGQWTAPCHIMVQRAAHASRIEPVLHFPHIDYARNAELVGRLGFRKHIQGEDLLAYAQIVALDEELTERFEHTLLQTRRLIRPGIIERLKGIKFLRSSQGGLDAPPNLYRRTALTLACVGEKGPFVVGSHVALYELLGCRDIPQSDDIVAHLDELRSQNLPPKRPDMLYPALVEVLRLEKRSPGHYRNYQILWGGEIYHSPAETLLGPQHQRVFLRAVPQIDRVSQQVRQAFQALGASVQPQPQHWQRLFQWFAEKYRTPGGPVSQIERRALITAYSRLHAAPDGLTADAKFLLDRDGFLHTRQDVLAGQLVMDDDPELADAIRSQRVRLAFADTSDPTSIRFFTSESVKTLTSVRQRAGVRIGDECPAPSWFVAGHFLRRIHTDAFASALHALTVYTLRDNPGIAIPGIGRLSRRLRSVEQLAFAQALHIRYRIAGSIVSVPTDVILDRDRILLGGVHRPSDVYGLLAQAVAGVAVESLKLQRNLTDPIYRLLTCRSPEEVSSYLKSRGIPWSHNLQFDLDDEEDTGGPSGDDDASQVGDLLAGLIKKRVGKRPGSGRHKSTDDLNPKPPNRNDASPHSVQLSLPPIETVRPQLLPQSTGWTPNEHRRGGGGGGAGVWTPRTPADQERDRLVGRRGEELIYLHELERVVALGHPTTRVVWESESNPGAGYDILSVDEDGGDLWIEVKSTTTKHGRFDWSINEFERALAARTRYVLWRVYEADSQTPRVRCFRDPISLLLGKGMRLDISDLSAEVEPVGK